MAVGLVIADRLIRREREQRAAAESLLQERSEQHARSAAESSARSEAALAVLRREVAERQAAEDALRQSESRLRATLDAVMVGCQLIGPDWRCLYVNEVAAQHCRRHKQELIGHPLQACHPGIERLPFFAALRRCMDERQPARLQHEQPYPDGTTAWFEVSFVPAPEGVMIYSLEITARKQAEETQRNAHAALDLRLRERTAQLDAAHRELEAFTSSITQDFRAPLRQIDGHLQELHRSVGSRLDDSHRRQLDGIAGSTRQLGRLIDELLAFSRLGRTPLRLEPVELQPLISAVIAEGNYQQPGKPILWAVGPLPPVQADVTLLRQVWFHLIDNAVKYSGKNPHPRIAIACRADAAARELIFSVADNGVGFDPRYADQLFGVFQRLHRAADFDGTGIGLANVRRIIARHGGRTWAESRIGEGATFFFSLPATAAPAAPAPQPSFVPV